MTIPDTWLELLDQDHVWLDVEGAPHLIASMDPAYCRRVLAWLHRNAANIAEQIATTLDRAALPDVDTAAYDVVAFSNETNAMRADPHAWLAGTPLITSLRIRAGWLTTTPEGLTP
ncbi:hypothetical protein [Nonomuraea glycinis]|uniref:hypothetical protein n=1 Tax=Nonomuraea glycinis TaxID=2047744 RepID=UPI0033B97490